MLIFGFGLVAGLVLTGERRISAHAFVLESAASRLS